MQTRYVEGLTIRPLRNGDTGTVAALFDRLGTRSREKRFYGAKPRLSDNELTDLARVDGQHHVLVGYFAGDPQPAGIARLVRYEAAAEIAFEVADAYQGRGIGSILARELAADAPAAGIRELLATVRGDNPPVVSLLKTVAHRLRRLRLVPRRDQPDRVISDQLAHEREARMSRPPPLRRVGNPGDGEQAHGCGGHGDLHRALRSERVVVD